MSFRLVMMVVVGTGILLAKQGLNSEAVESFRGGGGDRSRAATVNLMQSAPAPRDGAKRLTVAPDAPAEPSMLERLGWDSPQVRAAFALAGINIGSDPRRGNDLDALKARQRDALGELSFEEIGIDGFAEQIDRGMDMAVEVGTSQRFDAYDPQRNGFEGGGMQVLEIER